MKSQPVRNQQALTQSKVQCELILIGKSHAAHADRYVQGRIECAPPAEKDLAGEYVVAYVQIVVREAPPRVADYRDIRKNVLEAGRFGLGPGHLPLHENPF